MLGRRLTVTDYLSYLQGSLSDADSARKRRSANTENVVALIQQLKNRNAPTISGGNANSPVGYTEPTGNPGLLNTLKQAGFSGKGLSTAYAIAMAESGGKSTAHNPNVRTGDNSYGLFQINMLGSMGPERRKAFGLKSNEQLFDALTNAKIAYKMSKGGTNWQPWSTYKTGAYKKYLGSTGNGYSSQQSSWSGSVGKVAGGKTSPIAGGKWGYAYGSRNSRYSSGYHTGWDFSTRQGTPVRAAAGGVVSYTGSTRGGYGTYVKVKHSDGTTSLYGHLSGYNVKAGQKVRPGQVIARSGNTGNSSGPHLHFEVRKTDRYGGDINPRSWLSSR